MLCAVCRQCEANYLFLESGSAPRCNSCLGKPYEGGETMLGFGENEDQPVKAQSGNQELKDLLIAEAGNADDRGILQIAKGQLTGDLHQRKIARAIEIIRGL